MIDALKFIVSCTAGVCLLIVVVSIGIMFVYGPVSAIVCSAYSVVSSTEHDCLNWHLFGKDLNL